MKIRSFLLIAAVAAAGTAGFKVNGEASEASQLRKANSQEAGVAVRAAACRKKGLTPNETTGDCTDIPLPHLFR